MTMPTQSLRVAVVWGDTVYQERTFLPTSRPDVRVGEGDTNEFSLPAPALPEQFRMFVRTGAGYRLRLPAEVDARLSQHGEETTWEQLREQGATDDELDASLSTTQSTALDVDDWGVVELGHVELFFQIIEHRDRVAGRGLRGVLDGSVVLALLAAALLMGGVLVAAFLSFDPALEYEQPAHSDQWARVLVDDVEDPVEDKEEDEETQRSSKAAGGEEGQVGEPELENETELAEVEGPEVKELEDPTDVGVNKALGSELLGSGPLQSMFGDKEGFDERMNAAIAGDPGEFVPGRGTRGLSMQGDGRGGPDDGDSFGQVGGLGHVNSGGKDPTDADIGSKQEREVGVMDEGEVVSGELCEAASVRRVVQNKANAIKYCYERQLQQHPDMSGKVVAQWKIMPDGSVSAATIVNSTLESSSGGSRAVERCMTRVVGRMRFEKPDDGICVINYPFVFSGVE